MNERLTRREFGALAAGAALFGQRPSFLSAQGVPLAGVETEFTQRRPLPEANPSGDQVFRITGPIVDPFSIDPALVRDLSSGFLTRLVFRGLIVFDRELTPCLELAQRLVVSADGLTYTFTIDPRALFHNGQNVTADDVAWSLTRALDPATANGQAALLSGPTFLDSVLGAQELHTGAATELEGVRVIDQRTVEIRLWRPDAAFMSKLASAATCIVDRNDVARGGDWWRQPNGSGPFKVTEWKVGEMLRLERSRTFIDGAPALERIEMPLGPSAGGAFNLYQQDRVDIVGIGITLIDQVQSPLVGMGDELIQQDQFATEYLAFRPDTPPMDDPIVRQAVAMAFPRHKIAEVTFEGRTREATGVVPPGMLGAEWPVEYPSYDPEAARALLATSGYAESEIPPIQIYSTGNQSVAAFRERVSETLGIEVTSFIVQANEFFAGLAMRQYPNYALYWGADYPDPATFLLSLFHSGAADNYIDYANPDFDALIDAAMAELDPAARAEIYARAQQVLIDDGVVIPTYHDVGYWLAKPWVKGVELTPLGLLQLETIWIER
ncbi:MAG: peptide ABC transporter substrate-binding protein [Thermomicrobiales bacterium]|nr:peptide ABC transporter substrate-binding protein [Thermomicrobiales bacterium]